MRTAESRAAWRYASTVLGILAIRLNETAMDLYSIELRTVGSKRLLFHLQFQLDDGLRAWSQMSTETELTTITLDPSAYADALIDRICEAQVADSTIGPED